MPFSSREWPHPALSNVPLVPHFSSSVARRGPHLATVPRRQEGGIYVPAALASSCPVSKTLSHEALTLPPFKVASPSLQGPHRKLGPMVHKVGAWSIQKQRGDPVEVGMTIKRKRN